jgi:SPP1 gp7 family putative phage head morphogenesis protein
MSVNPNKSTETRFTNTLNQLLRRIEHGLKKAQTPQEAIRILERYAASPEYKEWCDSLALNIATQVNKSVSKTWREAAKQAGRGSEIYDRIRSELYSKNNYQFVLKIKQNASMIQTFPIEIAKTLNEHVAHETIRGRRSEDILRDLMRRYPDTAKARLNLIARTEVSKTQTALVQSRAQSLGLDWYIWRTSEDSRVRTSHKDMEGILVKWSDPPSPEGIAKIKSTLGHYHAGDCPNCRCYPEPIVNLDYVTFPAKVYVNGTVEDMTRAKFEEQK